MADEIILCQAPISRGSNKGKPCENNVCKGKKFCGHHSRPKMDTSSKTKKTTINELEKRINELEKCINELTNNLKNLSMKVEKLSRKVQ